MFRQKLTEICQSNPTMITELGAKNFTQLTTSLKTAFGHAGRTALTAYLQSHNHHHPQIVINGVEYRNKGTSDKEFLTQFGVITIVRHMYQDEINGGEYVFPMDKALGLVKDDFATLETQEMILYATAFCTPCETATILAKTSMCNPSKTAIQHIIEKDGTTVETNKQQLSTAILNDYTLAENTQTIVASLDGANVLIREAGIKKGRKKERPTNQTDRASKSSTSYHNAMVGSISCYTTRADDNKPQRLDSIYTARMPQDNAITFKEDFIQMLDAIEGKSEGKNVNKILLTDGHLMIKGFFNDNKERFESYEKLLDFYHTTEHLSKAAEALYGKKSADAQSWFKTWRDQLSERDDAPAAILRSMKGFHSRHTLTGKREEALNTEITFFKNNKHLMKYADFRRRGLPIGSGPIEAAAKTIVKQRMCRSGMSWSINKGQHVLSIRAIVQSGLWDCFWLNYKRLKNVA